LLNYEEGGEYYDRRNIMKEVDAAIKAVAEGLRSLAQGVEKIAEKLEESAPKKKPAVQRKAGAKPARKTKTNATAKSKKATAEKAPAKKATAADTVLTIINRSKKDVSVATLSEKTGFGNKKIANIVFKLKKMGKIKTVSKGVYAKI
jgi:predicted Rossmann fold nucleotide-binding protein DprA/Smf involved in DNA uptake